MPAKAEATVNCDVKDLGLAEAGRRRVEWAFQSMPVLQTIRKRFIKEQPLAGVRVAACLDVTAEAANLMIVLRDGGADPVLCGANPLSTQDDVAATLVRDYSVPVFAFRDATDAQCYSHFSAALDHKPNLTVDNGCSLGSILYTRRVELLDEVLCGTEEAATGGLWLKAMAKDKTLRYPVIAIDTRHNLENRHGIGDTAIDSLLRVTNSVLAGLTVVVAGYGSRGRGACMRAKALGANVIVTEVNPIRALEALMDGNRVMSMAEAAIIADVILTATGNKDVIHRDLFDKFKNGVIVATAGQASAEIDLEALGKAASARKAVAGHVDEYVMRDGRRIYALADSRLSSADGRPASQMDLSFATQALAIEHVLKTHASLEKRIHPVPDEIDRQVARMKLESMSVKIDRLSVEQEKYLASWSEAV